MLNKIEQAIVMVKKSCVSIAQEAEKDSALAYVSLCRFDDQEKQARRYIRLVEAFLASL